MAHGPESLVKNRIKQHLRSAGAYVFLPVQMGLGVSTVDIVGCAKGKFFGIEVKREGGKPTPRQAQVLEAIRKAGGIAFWADSYESFLLNAGLWDLLPRDTK